MGKSAKELVKNIEQQGKKPCIEARELDFDGLVRVMSEVMMSEVMAKTIEKALSSPCLPERERGVAARFRKILNKLKR